MVVGSIFKSDVFMFQFKAHNEMPLRFFFLNLDLGGVSSVNVFENERREKTVSKQFSARTFFYPNRP